MQSQAMETRTLRGRMAPAASRSPPSLKGVTSTNDDPHACALCSVLFAENMVLSFCCGKHFCDNCNGSQRSFISSGRALLCSFCNNPAIVTDKGAIGALKKHAKKGAAWAQFKLGYYLDTGECISQSDTEAKRWYEKAAKQGHPRAAYYLAMFHLDGRGGCSVDQSKARQLTQEAIALDPNDTINVHLCRTQLVHVADRVDNNDEAKSILFPLAEGGMELAQRQLGFLLFDEDGTTVGKRWFEAAALQGHECGSTILVLISCECLQQWSEANFWFNVVSRSNTMADKPSRIMKLVGGIGRNLRQLRNNCGGCGADLEQPEPTSSTNRRYGWLSSSGWLSNIWGRFGTSTTCNTGRRLYCGQCKTYCYCSRDCQKLHWNRTGEGGHRSECMGVKRIGDKMASANPSPHSARSLHE
mmetsp:Transcript_17400/g.38487  ORF Transcript_17400/g.38487 Transcript_17400/m.38487 type:complete len:414 (-) Transcript_17400:219-1460(-)